MTSEVQKLSQLMFHAPRPQLHMAIRAIPIEDRGAIVAKAFTKSAPSGYKSEHGLTLLSAFPSKELTLALLLSQNQGRLSRQQVIERLRKIAARSKAVQRALDETLKGASTPRKLRRTKRVSVTDTSKLTELQVKQLRRAFFLYDRSRRSAQARLSAGEDIVKHFGILEGRRRVFDVYVLNTDSGTIFSAGTLEVIAKLVHNQPSCEDEILEDALHHALQTG